jgi:branched-chain amino acid transport system ATP-binding protein
VSFGHVVALDDVTLAVERGEILGLIGPNGSGKTTMVNVVNGFLEPSSGRVLLGGEDVTRRSPAARARAGLARTFQAVRLFGHLTVAQNIEIGALAVGASRREARARVAAMLEQMGLVDSAAIPAKDLPYGLERRVSVARATAGRPDFLLLDEPAAGLNEDETDDLLEVLRDTRERLGCGVMIIEHDMSLISRLCDRLHVLETGATIASGPAREVMQSDVVIEAYLGRPHRFDDAPG